MHVLLTFFHLKGSEFLGPTFHLQWCLFSFYTSLLRYKNKSCLHVSHRITRKIDQSLVYLERAMSYDYCGEGEKFPSNYFWFSFDLNSKNPSKKFIEKNIFFSFFDFSRVFFFIAAGLNRLISMKNHRLKYFQ